MITKKGHPRHQLWTENSARLEEFNINEYIKILEERSNYVKFKEDMN